jgi:2-polyprenyl-3-methyl-5-hydroxy-6-metoxy-1,4-benzoquinol methylase
MEESRANPHGPSTADLTADLGANRPCEDVVRQLLALNRDFYAAAGAAFDATRQEIPPGMLRAVAHAPVGRADAPLRVLDAGCGNGRLVHALASLGRPVDYLGVDGDGGLLDAAARRAAPSGVRRRLLRADLATPGWEAVLPQRTFDFILCLATLHHLPGRALRSRVLGELAQLLGSQGRLVVSAWQFADSPRLVARTLPWSTIGLSEEDVEPGDALLPWDAGVHAVRYVHLIDEAELDDLATDAGLVCLESWRADGRSCDLTLYALLAPMRSPGDPSEGESQ